MYFLTAGGLKRECSQLQELKSVWKTKQKKKKLANVFCLCAASEWRAGWTGGPVSQDGLWARPETGPASAPARLSPSDAGNIGHVPVCGGRSRGTRAAMWIINWGPLHAFARSPSVKYNVHLHSLVPPGRLRLRSFNLYICLCV